MTAAEPPPWRFSTATNPLSSPSTATDTTLDAPFTNRQPFISVQTILSEFNSDLIATNERRSKRNCHQFRPIPPQSKTLCPGISFADDLSNLNAVFKANLKQCFSTIIDVTCDESSHNHEPQGSNLRICKPPKSEPCPSHALIPPAPETRLLPMKSSHLSHNLICDDVPPPKPPHALQLVLCMLTSDMRPDPKISHQPRTANYVSTTPTIRPMVKPHVVMPALAPNIHNAGASMVTPDTIPDKGTPHLQSLGSRPFSTPFPGPAVFSIHSTEFFSVTSVLMNGTLLSNRKKFHGKYPHHYQDDGHQHLHQHLPFQQAVATH